MVLPQLPTYTYGYFKYQQIITKHVHCESHFDFLYAVIRWLGFNSAPKMICFELLHHLMCFIYHHCNVPLMFSNKKLSMETVSSHFRKAEIKSIHSYKGLVSSSTDFELAQDLVDHHSVASCIHKFNGTAFDWTCTKHMDCATGSNRAETCTLYKCAKTAI